MTSEMICVRKDALNWLMDRYPTLCVKSGLCERIENRLHLITSSEITSEPSLQQEPGAEPDQQPDTDPMLNPFIAGRRADAVIYYTTAEDRIRALQDATAEQLEYVLGRTDLQKTVIQAAERLLRKGQSSDSA